MYFLHRFSHIHFICMFCPSLPILFISMHYAVSIALTLPIYHFYLSFPTWTKAQIVYICIPYHRLSRFVFLHEPKTNLYTHVFHIINCQDSYFHVPDWQTPATETLPPYIIPSHIHKHLLSIVTLKSSSWVTEKKMEKYVPHKVCHSLPPCLTARHAEVSHSPSLKLVSKTLEVCTVLWTNRKMKIA